MVQTIVGAERVGIGAEVVLPRLDVIVHHQREEILLGNEGLIFVSEFGGSLFVDVQELKVFLIPKIGESFTQIHAFKGFVGIDDENTIVLAWNDVEAAVVDEIIHENDTLVKQIDVGDVKFDALLLVCS